MSKIRKFKEIISELPEEKRTELQNWKKKYQRADWIGTIMMVIGAWMIGVSIGGLFFK